jgi:hypothetical protein
VFRRPEELSPPHTIISEPDQTAVWPVRGEGVVPSARVAVHVFETGS